jgi:hypothetical protein
MLAPIIRFPDKRTEQVAVPRAALSAASENSLAASRNIQDAVDRCIGHVFAGQRAAALHQLERIGFEAGQRNEALANLTSLAETAPRLQDGAFVPVGDRGAA